MESKHLQESCREVGTKVKEISTFEAKVISCLLMCSM